MHFIYIFYLFSIIVIFLTGCSSVYMPNVPATPMFKNQGEVHLAAHVNTKGNISGTAGLAVSEHVAVLANTSYVNYGKNSNRHFNQWLVEGAVGYYATFGAQKRQVLEVYGGYGIGNTMDIDKRASVVGYDEVQSKKMDFDKMFVQVNFSSSKKKKINLFGEKRNLNYGTAIRLSRLMTKNLMLNNVVVANEENIFIEPVFFTRMELTKGFQIQYTNGFNFGLMGTNHLKAFNSVFTLGLVYNFGKK